MQKETKKKEIKKARHFRALLSGMTPSFNCEAFTLIELLVVVLIIGILAAIALPQYEKAVIKSRAAEAFTNLKTLKNALEICELEHGRITTENFTTNPCSKVENLNIQLGERDADDAFSSEHFSYILDHHKGLSGSEEIAGMARYRQNGDLCICIYDDNHFTAPMGNDLCNGIKNYAKTLNLPEDENCSCC